MGFPPQLESDPEDHEYVFFDLEHSGLEFREVKVDDHSDDGTPAKLHEMVLTWTPKSAPYSAHFAREAIVSKSAPPYPEYHIGDLWSPHPDPVKSRYVWRFAGRIDNLITLAAGVNLSPGTIEQALLAHNQVKAAIVIGNKRLQPLVLIELVSGTGPETVSEIWRSVLEPLNAKMQSHSRIAESHTLVVPADGLERTSKGTISRVKSERKFSEDIEAVYRKFGDVWQDKGRPDRSTA
jgi:acyl-CoA synthetase (AMP-forming)/AMP-acid ligase II